MSRLITWRLGLIALISVMAIAFAFGFALTGKTLQGLTGSGDALSIAVSGQEALQVTGMRRPDQPKSFLIDPKVMTTQIDGFDTYAQVDTYLAHQDQIIAILNGPSVIVSLKHPNGLVSEAEVRVEPLKISQFEKSFWVSLGVGLTAFLIGGSVWCLKPNEAVTQTLAVNGLGMLIAAVSSCVTFAQPLALSGQVEDATNIINHAGTVIFGLSLVGIFLLFPKQLISTRSFLYLMAAGLPLFLLDAFRLGFPSALFIFCFAVIAAVVGLVITQFFVTKGAPDARAALLWLALGAVVSGVSWGIIIAAYILQGQFQTMPESYIFLSFLILYLGIAIGVARFRLFDISDWAFRIFFFTVAALLFIVLDAGLIYLVGLAHSSALALALLMVAFGYLPLRDLLWRRFVRTDTLSDSDMLASVLDMAFAPEASQRQQKWQALLHRLFEPQSISPVAQLIPATAMDRDGLHIFVPANMDMSALQLSYPHGGRGLFSPRDVALVEQVLRLSRKATLGLSAYERGATEQRLRLAQDLHDDVGARLVSGLAVADDASRPFIYAALNDIREIAAAMTTESVPLERVLAEMRHEAVRRLDTARIALEWPLWPEDAAYAELTALQKKALTSAVREAVTNIIKHAEAQHVDVDFHILEQRLNVYISDDGKGYPETVLDGLLSGQGLKSITDRLDKVNGRAHFKNQTVGAVVELELPLLIYSGSAGEEPQ